MAKTNIHLYDFENEDFVEFLKELLDSGKLKDGSEYADMKIGIVKQVVSKGWNLLSPKQQKILQWTIVDKCYERCTYCGDSIPWCEMMFAIEHDGMCSHCVHVWEEIEKE